jgi:beta-galactosidase
MTKNGTDKVKLISQLDMKIEGMGAAFVSPYEPVTGATYSSSRGDVGRGPEDSASMDKDMETVLTYENLDFGEYGSDEITLSIYANDSDAHNVQIWQGVPEEEGSRLLGDVIYKKPGIWETFQPDTYKLNERVKGVATISIVGHDKWFIRDFSFTKQEKAFGRLDVAEYGVIYGDSYEKLEDRVEHIGNNVSFGYEGMNFGKKGTDRITICGRTPLETNTIQIRFVGEQESVQVVSFPHTDEYTELTFDIERVTGENQVTFVFLPGCNFDFRWFRFER